MTLQQLGETFGTDKKDHGFLPFYEKHFYPIRYDVKKFLEIGVLYGKSLLMWKEFFPNATIYGIDNFQDGGVRDLNVSSIKILKYNQNLKEDLINARNELGNDFDIIIDDGCHFHKPQQQTLEYFFPMLRKKGLYGIEDLHSMNASVYGYPSNHPYTTFNVLNKFKQTKKIITENINEKEYLENNIDTIDIFISEKTCHLGNSITSIITKQ